MVLDKTQHIIDEGNIVGFVFGIQNKKTTKTSCSDQEPTPKFSIHDDDSIWTLHPSDRTTLTAAKVNARNSQPKPISSQPSNITSESPVTSQYTTITVESSLQLESRVFGLPSQILVHQNRHIHQFNIIMQSLSNIQGSTGGQDNPPDTSNSNTARSTNTSKTSGRG